MEYKSFMEALKGKQHKIDKNKNGQIDAHDFKLLRKEEVEELDELSKSTLGSYAKKASRDAVITRKIGADFERKADAARSPGMQSANTELSSKYKQKSWKRRDGLEKAVDRLTKEEVEQIDEATVKTQKYSWGTMKTVHHGSDFSIPLHPEHHQEIAKLKDQQEHKFKTEDGKHWSAKRSGDDVHFQGANGGNSTTVKHSTMSESVEELDEIRRMKTKLNKLDPVSHMSVARQKLSNLMKSGKARGALVANKMRTLNMGDDIDQEDLDALYEVMSKDAKAGDYISDFVHSTNPKFEGKSKKERINMALGAYYNTHKKKDGVSEGYQSYSGPSHGHAYGGSGFGRREREDDEYHVPDPVRKPQTPSHAPVAPVPDRKYIKGTPENKALKASRKPINGHPTNEEVEEIEERNKENAMMRKTMDASRGARYKLNNPVPDADPKHKTARDHNVAIGRALRNEDKMTTQKDKNGKLISFKYEGDWKKSDPKKNPEGKVHNLAGQAMKKMQQANEEVEQLDELGNTPAGRTALKAVSDRGDKEVSDWNKNPKSGFTATPKKVVKRFAMGMKADRRLRMRTEEKDEQEYGYEGDMALNQLKTLVRCAEMIEDMLKPDTDMPEWVQSKITLATDYIQTAADYMHSEMNEAKSVEVKVNAAGDAAHEEKWEPVKKIKKPVVESFDDEGNLIPTKISYKDFITEIKLADLPVRRIQGRSYGANYSDPEGADDYDDKKPMKPAAEKRGRGRPAGAKSGARKITGTSKLMNK
jgi:hypothetical protein